MSMISKMVTIFTGLSSTPHSPAKVREKEDFCPACQTHSTTELKVQNGPISLVIVALKWNHPAEALHSRIMLAIDLLCGCFRGVGCFLLGREDLVFGFGQFWKVHTSLCSQEKYGQESRTNEASP
jgi:hypothetical protein